MYDAVIKGFPHKVAAAVMVNEADPVIYDGTEKRILTPGTKLSEMPHLG